MQHPILSRLSLFAFLCIVTTYALAQSPVGIWKTVDDESGKERSIVEIWQGSDGKLYGKIQQLLTRLPGDHPQGLCDACEGALHMKPILGMTIINGLQLKSGFWQGGTIFDPKKGVSYKCEVWLEGNDKLKVRGIHWSGMYRTQTWSRVK